MKIKSIIISTIIVIITILIILIISHYFQITKIKESIEIAQIENNDMDKINLVIKDNIPLIINHVFDKENIDIDILKENNTKILAFRQDPSNKIINSNISIHDAYQLYKSDKGGFRDIIINGLLDKSLEDKFIQYKSPISINTETTVSCLPLNYVGPLTKKYYNLNLFLVETGSVTFQLYHPKYKPYLTRRPNQHERVKYSEIWETDENISNNAKYIEIIVRKGQVIIIPSQWIYNYKTMEKTVMMNFNSLDIMGPLMYSLSRL